MQSLCSRAHTSCQYCIGYCSERSQRAACQSSLPTLQSALCQLRRCQMLCGVWWYSLHSQDCAEWDSMRMGAQTTPSLLLFQIEWCWWGAPSTAVRREQGKLNCRDPQHQKHKKEPKLQVQISRDMQVFWSKLYPHNFWHMLSVLIPVSLRSVIKLWPPQNHKMFEVRRSLTRWSNPTVLLRAMSAGAAF